MTSKSKEFLFCRRSDRTGERGGGGFVVFPAPCCGKVRGQGIMG